MYSFGLSAVSVEGKASLPLKAPKRKEKKGRGGQSVWPSSLARLIDCHFNGCDLQRAIQPGMGCAINILYASCPLAPSSLPAALRRAQTSSGFRNQLTSPGMGRDLRLPNRPVLRIPLALAVASLPLFTRSSGLSSYPPNTALTMARSFCTKAPSCPHS
ncbi:hypothetical protein BC827DRAFT_1193216 [Russula dissimulans]|nr:hypothetical protein BC827DRAFT_1193216 [Russula dissimulans]